MKRFLHIWGGILLAILSVSNLFAQLPDMQDLGVWNGRCQTVAVQGDRAVAGSDSFLTVLNLKQTPEFEVLAEVNLHSVIEHVQVLDTLVYAALGDSGMQIYTIKDLANIREIGRFSRSRAHHIRVIDNIAYVAAMNDGLRIVDVSNPAAPNELGNYIPETEIYDVSIVGNTAFLAAGYVGMYAVDITYKETPSYISVHYTPGDAYEVEVLNTRAYIANTFGGLRIVDVSAPGNMLELGFYEGPKNATSLKVFDRYAFVTSVDSGLFVIDTSNPAAPSEVMFVPTDSSASFVHWADHRIFVADGGGGLHAMRLMANAQLIPSVLNFQETYLTNSDIILQKIKNTSQFHLVLDSVQIEGANSDQFAVGNFPGANTVINPGDSLSLNVMFEPTNQGRQVAQLRLFSNSIGPDVTQLAGQGMSDYWTIYNQSNSSLLINNYYDIDVDGNGRVMAVGLGDGAGIADLNGTTWMIWNTQNSNLENNNVICVEADHDRNVWWFGTSGGGLTSFDGQQWQTWTTATGGTIPNDTVTAVSIDSQHRVWMGFISGDVAMFNPDSAVWHILNSADILDSPIQTLAVNPLNGVVCVGSQNGAALFTAFGQAWQTFTTSNSGLPNNNVIDIAYGPDGYAWFATFGGGVAEFDGIHWNVFNKLTNGIASDSVMSVEIDGGNNVWLGHLFHGITLMDKLGDIQIFNAFNSGLPLNDVRTIAFADSATKWIATNGGGIARYNELRGTLEPHVLITRNSLNFGDLGVGQTGRMSTIVVNTGNTKLNISSVVLDGLNPTDFTLFQTDPFSVPYGGTYQLDVQFNPSAAGPKTAFIQLNDNAPSNPDIINLSGNARGGEVTFIPDSINFGNIPQDTTKTDTFYIVNSGLAALNINSLQVIEPNPGIFTTNTQFTATLSPGDSATISVTFSPQFAGTVNGAGIIVNSDSYMAPDTIRLYGAANAPETAYSPNGLNFGQVLVNSVKLDSIYIRNVGLEPLIIDSVVVNGADSVAFTRMAAIGGSILPGDSLLTTVEFHPQQTRGYRVNLIVNSNALTNPDTLELRGQGIWGEFSYWPDSPNFGNVRVGSTKIDSFYVKNIGYAPLNVQKFQVNSELDTIFRVIDTLAITLAPNDSQAVRCSFKPAIAGSVTGSVTVTSDALTSPDIIYIRGTGVQPVMQLSKTYINYGNVFLGRMVPEAVTVYNIGTDTLHVGPVGFSGDSLGFTMTTPKTFSIAMGDSETIRIRFAPQTVRNYNAYLNVYSDGGSSVIELIGAGIIEQASNEGLIAFYPFDGNTLDVSGNEHHGTNHSATLVSDRSGRDSSAYRFNGSSYIIISDSLKSTDITICAWVNPSLMSVPWMPIISYGNNGHLLAIDETGHIVAGVQGNNASLITSNDSLALGSWAFVAVTRDTDNVVSIYYNGQLDISGISSSLPSFHYTPNIGHDPSSYTFQNFRGDIDEVRIYDRALTAEEIDIVYNYSPAEPILSVSPIMLNFGNVSIGTQNYRDVRITNIGQDTLILATPTFANGAAFYISELPDPFRLLPADFHDIRVYFSPSAIQLYSDTLNISSNGGSQQVLLMGTGTSASALYFPYSTIRFDTVEVGYISARTYTITNISESAVQFSSISIAGTNTSVFGINTVLTYPYILEPDSNLTLVLNYSPNSVGVHMAELIYTSSAESSPDSIQLYGYGTVTGYATPEITYDTTAVAPGRNLTFNVTLPIGFTPTAQHLYYRIAGDTAWTHLLIPLTQATGTIPASAITSRGVQYYWEMTDGTRTITYPAHDVQDYPAFVEVHVARLVSGARLEPLKYKMISVPYEIARPNVTDVLYDDYGAYDIRNYRILRWNEYDSSYAEYMIPDSLDEYSYENWYHSYALYPGYAYWLVTRTGTAFDIENAVAHASPYPFQIFLEPGWNMMADPFPYPISIDNIEVDTTQISKPIFFDGSQYLYDRQVMMPWEGYFVYNFSETYQYASILPIAVNAGMFKENVRATQTRAGEFVLQISAQIPESDLIDSQNFVGFKKDAEDGFERMDYPEAPPIDDVLRLSVMEKKIRLAGSFKSINPEGQYWDVVVSTSKPMQKPVMCTLTEFGERLPDQNIYILDKDYQCALPVRSEQFVVYLSKEIPVRHFRIIIGTENYASANSESIPLAPLVYQLDQNYPNPFNPTTTIRYQLAMRSHVTIEVFNMIGQKIRTLVNETQMTGQHTIRWDARNDDDLQVASGVYLYRIQAGEFVASKKLVLIR
ncbi:choice-of-anchor D domain-containing protein [candidate division KSB1 bacterium]|nr:choice-of-anchor D domain-containing protein [candidate division KSB1 bacterium]